MPPDSNRGKLVPLVSCYTQPVDPDPFTWMSMSRRSYNNSWPICWWVFATYICVDTLWVALFPRCVANANTILLHHALCIGGWWLGTQWSELECDVSSSLIVEFNTWLLILKRKFVEDSFGSASSRCLMTLVGSYCGCVSFHAFATKPGVAISINYGTFGLPAGWLFEHKSVRSSQLHTIDGAEHAMDS